MLSEHVMQVAERIQKACERAGRSRDELKSKGIILEDTPQGVKWHRN